MNTNTHSELVTISTSDLGHVTGGDAGGDYTHTLKKDFLDMSKREGQTIDAVKNKDWKGAAVNGVRSVVDGVKVMSDAWSPVKDFLGFGHK